MLSLEPLQPIELFVPALFLPLVPIARFGMSVLAPFAPVLEFLRLFSALLFVLILPLLTIPELLFASVWPPG